MEPENSSTLENSSNFSIKTPFSKETYKKFEALFQNNKWKQLSIEQGNKLLIKLHADVLEEDFPETLEMFESNTHLISLPEKLKADCIEILIKYLYLREIFPAISINKTFQLLNLAVFLKIRPLIKEIKESLSGNTERHIKYSKDQ